jgi:hypothetical protein
MRFLSVVPRMVSGVKRSGWGMEIPILSGSS